MDYTLINFSSPVETSSIYRHKTISEKFIKNTNFFRAQEIIRRIINHQDSLSLLKNDLQNGHINHKDFLIKNILNPLKSELFHLKGKLIYVNQEFINEKNLFNLDIKIRDDRDFTFTIFFNNIGDYLVEYFNSFPKFTMLYFLRLKAIFGKSKSGNYELQFFAMKKTRMFYSHISLGDEESPLIFNSQITLKYETKKLKLKEQRNLERSRICLGGSNGTNYTQEKFITLLKTVPPAQTVKISTEPTINEELSNILKEIPQNWKMFSNFLETNAHNLIHSMGNVSGLTSQTQKINICGIVKSARFDARVTSVEVVSLIDSNVMKIIHYPNTWVFAPEEKMVISITAIQWKINKNFEFILENPMQNNVRILGKLSNEEAAYFKKFRFGKKKEVFDCLIDLLKPVMKRNIQKVLISIKTVNKITARFEVECPSYSINGFPYLKLFAKVVIDDGSYEAQMNIYDETVVRLLRLDKETLEKINSIVEEMSNVILFDKSNFHEVLPKECLKEIFLQQYIAYCVPYSKIASKNFNDNKINKYLQNLGQKNHTIKNQAMNLAFINGDVFCEKAVNGEMHLSPKPLLKAVHIESILTSDVI